MRKETKRYTYDNIVDQENTYNNAIWARVALRAPTVPVCTIMQRRSCQASSLVGIHVAPDGRHQSPLSSRLDDGRCLALASFDSKRKETVGHSKLLKVYGSGGMVTSRRFVAGIVQRVVW